MSLPQAARIILIDDNPSVLEVVSRILRAYADFDISTADSVLSGLDACHAAEADLIIIDYELGDRTGLEFLRHVRSAPSTMAYSTPIIMLTGSGADGLEQQALSIGANAFLTKPVSARVLCETVDRLLSVRHSIPADHDERQQHNNQT